MNDDSDESEHVEDSERPSAGRQTRTIATKFSGKRSKNAHVIRTTPPNSIAALKNQSNSENIKTTAPQKIKSDTLRSYRDLLNSTISEVLGPNEDTGSDAFTPSQIGVSVWTSKEKHRLLAAVQSRGSGDLSALATAIGTKSEPEVRAYILLLQEGVRELDAKATQQFGLADVPAAVEIGAELLEVEEALAAVVEGRTRAVEEVKEEQRWGEEAWLIDEDVAAAFDERYGDSDGEVTKDRENEDDEAEAVRITSGDGKPDQHPLSSDELLKASTFLQLSRTLFMNSANPEMNWHSISEADKSASEPSIRRTAFNDFHNLVISLTRRLMQASIFQATSRLRASSNPRLLLHVHGFDVAAARETLGLKTQSPEYWAATVKRCGTEVYSDSKKWRGQEGRQGTKNGVKLSEEEIKAELGVLIPDAAAHVPDIEDDFLDTEDFDSDAHTIASSSGPSDDDLSHAEVTVDARGRMLTDRRRPLSPASFARAETKYLDRVDRYNARDLENKYRDVLGLPVTEHKHGGKPGFPYKQADIEPRPKDWTAALRYEAPWEQPQGMPRRRDFDAMEMEGTRRRKRRRLNAGGSNIMDVDGESEHGTQHGVSFEGQADNDTEAESGTKGSSESGSDNEGNDKGGVTLEGSSEPE
jgi:RNA polymerase I-specific transcription initiation factor RRN5